MGLVGRTLVVWALVPGCLASPATAPGEPDDCGTLSSLSDEFGAGLSPWRWYPDGLWAAENAAIQLTPSPGTYSGIFSRQSWQVEGGELVVAFDLAAMAPDSLVEVKLVGVEGEILLALDDEVLRADVYQDDFEGTRDSVAFDPEMDWWRIGRTGGRMHWATSTNGEDWVEQGEFDADLAGLAEVYIQNVARGESSAITVEAVNSGEPGQPLCRLDSFRDDFSGELDPRWRIVNEELCEVRLVDDRAELGLSGPDACGLRTRERFSVADNEVSVQLADAGDCGLNPILQVSYDGAALEMGCHPGSPPILVAFAYGEDWGEELGMTDFDPLEDQFLRMRHAPAEGGLLFETSPDRMSWSRLGVWDDFDPAALSSVEIALIVYSETPGEQVAAFDELNTSP